MTETAPDIVVHPNGRYVAVLDHDCRLVSPNAC